MTETSQQGNIQLTWQGMLWRLALTGLILLALASSGFVLFDTGAERSGAQVLPVSIYDTDSALPR